MGDSRGSPSDPPGVQPRPRWLAECPPHISASLGLSPLGVLIWASPRVGGTQELTWLAPVCPPCRQLCLTLQLALPDGPAFPPGRKTGRETYHFGVLFPTVYRRSNYSDGLGVLVGGPGDEAAQAEWSRGGRGVVTCNHPPSSAPSSRVLRGLGFRSWGRGLAAAEARRPGFKHSPATRSLWGLGLCTTSISLC